jgi:hypothetical protein
MNGMKVSILRVVVAYLKVMSWYLTAETDERHEKS